MSFTSERTRSWADEVDEEIPLPDSTASPTQESTSADNDDRTTPKDAEIQSHFSDSSSDAEVNPEDGPKEPDEPFHDFDSSYDSVADDVDEWESFPDVEDAAEYASGPDPYGEVRLTEAAVQYFEEHPEAMSESALLPVAGIPFNDDGDIVHRSADFVNSGGEYRGPAKKGKLSLAHTHGMPSRFKAEVNSDAKGTRYQIERDIARKERDAAVENQRSWKVAYDELEYESGSNLQTKREKIASLTKELEACSDSLKYREEEQLDCLERLRETKAVLAQRQKEAESWKKAFEAQKPLAMIERERRMRKDEGLDGKVDAETQTELEIAAADAESQMIGAKAQVSALTVDMGTQTPPFSRAEVAVQTYPAAVADEATQTNAFGDLPLAVPTTLRRAVAAHIIQWLQDQVEWELREALPSVAVLSTLLCNDRTTLADVVRLIGVHGVSVAIEDLVGVLEEFFHHFGAIPAGIWATTDEYKSFDKAFDRLIADHTALYEANVELQQQLQGQHEALTKAASFDTDKIDISALEQLMEQARALKTQCDQLETLVDELRAQNAQFERDNKVLQAKNGELLGQAEEHRILLGVSEDKREQMFSEKAKIAEKYSRVREWIAATYDSSAAARLPSPCTPLPTRPGRVDSDEWDRSWLKDSRCPRNTRVARQSSASVGHSDPQVIVNVEVQPEGHVAWFFWRVIFPIIFYWLFLS
jgi:hypothetical protein